MLLGVFSRNYYGNAIILVDFSIEIYAINEFYTILVDLCNGN